MKFLADFFPIALFFVAFKLYDIYVATAVAMVASVIQTGAFWLKHRRFETMHLVTLGIIMVFGGATLLFHDETFIKWKPTVLNWAFAVIFLGSQFIGSKTLVERAMGTSISLPNAIWLRLNFVWVVFFVALGIANLYVAYNYDLDTWVNFKLFGTLGLTIGFVLIQGIYLSRHMMPDTETGEK